MNFQTAYNVKTKYDENGELTEHGLKVVTVNDKPTMTKQALKDDADVNNIIKRYNKIDLYADAMELEAIYGEIDSMDLREAMDKVNASEEAFMKVPSEIRGQFENDAGKWIDYATDPANIDQMREWGFVNPEPPEEQPTKVEVVNPPETSPE